ncbi:uncharacterized protein LOC128293822 [Gossypium arboreum]|uniref:uncharacterized protein LOC128293822 n=1 Tax=Gossypium arboreum TaxID=29729 RepID=UPI0022F18DD2|nr:uncharacterized protein LOC128293822 [Gossypium arboreum]
MTYRKLYQSLYDAHAISSFHLKPLQPSYPKWYDANARCEYHAGIPGLLIKNCTSFKKAVERLIKMGVVKFNNTPNTENSLPNHSDQGVNAISEASERGIKKDVAEVRMPIKVMMPMKVIWEEMVTRGMLTSKMREEKQGTMVSSMRKKVMKFKIVKNSKPWCRALWTTKSYKFLKVALAKNNVTVPEEENIASTSKDVQVEGSHTQSGKRYDTVSVREEPTKSKNVSAEKEKVVELPVKDPVKDVEAKEFLKFLNHSEYSMVKQLRRQPARISVLVLLLSSEVHRNALLRVLNETYVTHDISVNKMDRLVNNGVGGRGSTKALHITTRCKGYTLPSVFVDNGSALNVLLLSTLNILPIDGSHMKTCQNVVRAFDGTERKVIGRIDIPLEIGLSIYEVDILVMDIKPSYNGLLGRPWIHLAGAVPSLLHQKLKLVTNRRLVTINTEEDIIATVTRKAPYVETNKEFIECSFRSLEFVNATFISEGSEPPVPKIARAMRIALQMMVGKGALPGRGLEKYLQGGTQIPELKEKKDRSGLGFKPDYKKSRKEVEKRQEGRRTRLNGKEVEWEPMTFPPISQAFISGGLLIEESHQINAIHDDELDQGNL